MLIVYETHSWEIFVLFILHRYRHKNEGMQNIQGDHFIIGIYASASKKYVSLPSCQTSVLLTLSLSPSHFLYDTECYFRFARCFVAGDRKKAVSTFLNKENIQIIQICIDKKALGLKRYFQYNNICKTCLMHSHVILYRM